MSNISEINVIDTNVDDITKMASKTAAGELKKSPVVSRQRSSDHDSTTEMSEKKAQ